VSGGAPPGWTSRGRRSLRGVLLLYRVFRDYAVFCVGRKTVSRQFATPWAGKRIFHIYGTHEITMFMKQESIRTTVDIPAPLYRKLKEQAAGTGCSIRELVLLGVRRVVLQAQRPRPKRVEFPLIVSKGPQVDVTNERIYEHVEFP